ncbi:MAG: hypothetical protein E7655_02220 [Ruminococcaceae bacterium]|nr:hypothetical protein [Oscillospiraceae bacterium]
MTRATNLTVKNGTLKLLDIVFLVFCLCPFILPNPVVTTNIQPYAALFGTLLIGWEILTQSDRPLKGKMYFFIAAWGTLLVSLLVLLLGSEITVSSFRAVFNYYSVAIVPFAFYLILNRIGTLPETFVKILIAVWFAVSAVQFFIDRRFLTEIIGGVNNSMSYRGVVGLASEPSFLGIACFYFLHMVIRFKKHQMLFFTMTLIMGVVFAQSMMGILFIAVFLLVYLMDSTNTKKGVLIWCVVILAVIAFVILFNTVLEKTRLHHLITLLMQEGVDGLLNDVSAGNRYDSLANAIADSLDNNLMPLGYEKRIGSGYGGFLCELGFFALPILCCISLALSKTFEKTFSQIVYFVLVTILLFNNTQIGNPLLLSVIAINLYHASRLSVQSVDAHASSDLSMTAEQTKRKMKKV